MYSPQEMGFVSMILLFLLSGLWVFACSLILFVFGVNAEGVWQLGLGEGESGYPERPDEDDCIYYLRTGFCGYGARCRFNHPRERGPVKLIPFGFVFNWVRISALWFVLSNCIIESFFWDHLSLILRFFYWSWMIICVIRYVFCYEMSKLLNSLVSLRCCCKRSVILKCFHCLGNSTCKSWCWGVSWATGPACMSGT